MDAGVNVFVGLIAVIFTAAMIAGLWDTLSTYLGNVSIFPIGALALVIIGFIPLVLIIGIFKKAYDEIVTPKNPPMQGGGYNYG
jgi:hypothetical protein